VWLLAGLDFLTVRRAGTVAAGVQAVERGLLAPAPSTVLSLAAANAVRPV